MRDAPVDASATSTGILAVGGSGGSSVIPGDVLSGSASITIANASNPNQNFACPRSSLAMTPSSNPTPPGKATATITSQTFSSCTANGMFGVTAVSITTNASSTCPWTATIDDTTIPAIVTVGGSQSSGCSTAIVWTVDFQTFFVLQWCIYSPQGGSVVDTVSIGSALLILSSASLTKTSGPGTCFANVTFSGGYPLVDQSQGGVAVDVN